MVTAYKLPRREFSRAVRVAAFERAQGRCEHIGPDGHPCQKKLYPGEFHYDHIIADSIGGEPTLDNCQLLCRAHHAVKTETVDTPRAAKTKRMRDKHIGAKPKRPWPKGRGFSQWRSNA